MTVGRKSSRLSRTHGTPLVTRHSACQGPATEYAMSDASLNALTKFLSLGLRNYAVDLAPDDREHAVYEALHNLATKLFPPGDDTTLGSEEGSLLPKLWDYVAYTSPKKTRSSANSMVYKEAKNPNNFICGHAFAKRIARRSRGIRAPPLLQSKACLDRSLRGSVA